MKKLSELDLKKKKILIFDMDGTLIDSVGIYNQTDQYLLSYYGDVSKDLMDIQIERHEFLHQNTSSDIYIAYCDYLIKTYHLRIQDAKVLADIRYQLSTDILNKVGFKQDIPELILKLKDLGFTLVLATITTKQQIDLYANYNEEMIKYMNIRKVFDYIVTKDDVLKKKPDPEIYQHIARYYQALKEECLVFEDSYAGVLASHLAGIECVNVYDEYADVDREQINQLADYRILKYREFINHVNRVYKLT